MFNDRVVINASPLITLCKSGQEGLLPQLFHEIVVPSAVWDEVLMGGVEDPACQKLSKMEWLRCKNSIQIAPVVQSWDLGPGETAVLSFAQTNSRYIALVDDASARRCASALNIRVIGTLGVRVLARRRGLIQAVAPGLKSLKDAGLWISEELISRLIKNED